MDNPDDSERKNSEPVENEGKNFENYVNCY